MTMESTVIRNPLGTDRKVTKFALLPTFIGGKVFWLRYVTIHQDYVNGKWINLG